MKGRYAPKENTNEQQGHGGKTQDREVGHGGGNDGQQTATQEWLEGLEMGQTIASQELVLLFVCLQSREISTQTTDQHGSGMTHQ